MPTPQEVIALGRKLEADGDMEGAKRAAGIAAKMLQAGPQKQPLGSWASRGVANFVEGVANVPNAAINLATSGINAATGSEIPPLKAEIAPTMRQVGIPVAEGEPTSNLEAFTMGSGEAAAGLLPIAKGVDMARKGSGVVAGLADDIYRAFTRSTPAAVGIIAGEVAGGGGSRVGEKVAADQGYGPVGQVVGGAIGGIGGGLLATPVTTGRAVLGFTDDVMKHMPLYGGVRRKVLRDFAPYTDEGAFQRASDFTRSISEDAPAAARNILDGSEYGLSPSQMSDDPGLMSLEKAVAAADPAFNAQMRERNALIDRNIGEAGFRGTGEATAAKDFISGRRDATKDLLRQTVAQARERARSAAVEPGRSQMDNATLVREEINTAYEAARSVERRLWEELPLQEGVGTRATRDAVARIMKETPTTRAHDVPGDAIRFLGPNGTLGERTTVNELHGLYSSLREQARNLRSGNNARPNAARLADEVAAAILDDLGAMTGEGVGPQISAAINYSRSMNEVYNQGSVGKILSRVQNGGDTIADGLTLQPVGRGGNEGAQAIDDIRAATPDPTAPPASTADSAMVDFMRSKFTDAAVRNGEIKPDLAATFLRRNAEALDRLPDLAAELRQSVVTARRAASTTASSASRTKALDDPRRSATAAFTDAQSGKEFDAIFNSKNPVATAASIRRSAARDADGVSPESLKSGFLDYLMRRAQRGDANREGVRAISGNNLQALLNDSNVRGVAKQFLSEGDFGRLNRIIIEAKRVERFAESVPFNKIIDESPTPVLATVVRVLGAKAGAAAAQNMPGVSNAGTSLQAAQLGASRAARVLDNLTNNGAEKLLIDAVSNPELMRALLLNQKSPQAKIAAAERMLSQWVAGYAATQVAEDE